MFSGPSQAQGCRQSILFGVATGLKARCKGSPTGQNKRNWNNLSTKRGSSLWVCPKQQIQYKNTKISAQTLHKVTCLPPLSRWAVWADAMGAMRFSWLFFLALTGPREPLCVFWKGNTLENPALDWDFTSCCQGNMAGSPESIELLGGSIRMV